MTTTKWVALGLSCVIICGLGGISAQVTQSPAATSASAPPRSGDDFYSVDKTLSSVANMFAKRNYRQASTLGRAAVDVQPEVAWRVIGVSACSLKDKTTAAEAYGRADAEGKLLIEYACGRRHIDLNTSAE